MAPVAGAAPDAGPGISQLGLLVESVTDYAIFLLDPEGHVRTWNRGAERIKGWRADEIVGRHFSTFYTQVDKDRRHPDHELEVATAVGRFEEEGWRVRKDGSQFWANVVITALRDADERLVGFGKVTRDLTERREAEQQLRRAGEELRRTNAELERFAVVAAHDLREPLATVGAFVQLLDETEGERLTPAGRGHLATVGQAVVSMQALIEDLFTYARLGSTAIELVDVPLAPVVARALERLDASIAARGADVRVEVPDAAVVRVDRMGADALVQNLLSNAIKFGAADGPHVVVDAVARDSGWELGVRDDGAGVPPEAQARIFEPFERVRTAGATTTGQGLGLSICRRVADRSDGALGVASPPGGGSRFWFWLPGAAG